MKNTAEGMHAPVWQSKQSRNFSFITILPFIILYTLNLIYQGGIIKVSAAAKWIVHNRWYSANN